MPRIALANCLFGFIAISLATASGFFVAREAEFAYASAGTMPATWQFVLMKSAHGHLNLYGMVHILFGLTISHSRLPSTLKLFQSWALAAGTLTMGLFVFLRSFTNGPLDSEMMGQVMGLLLSASLASMLSHCLGLGIKLART